MSVDIPVAVSSEMEETNNYLTEAGRLIYTDPVYANNDWVVAAVVFNFVNGRENSFGYIFRHDHSWKAELPDDNNYLAMDQMLALQFAMEKQTSKKWQRALIHIWRDTGKMNVTFEYDDAKRWQINPGNLEESVNALRP